MSNDFFVLVWLLCRVSAALPCTRAGRLTRWFVRVLGALLTAVLRPVALGCIQLRQALRRPKAWLGPGGPGGGSAGLCVAGAHLLASPFAPAGWN